MTAPRNDVRAVLIMVAASILWPALEHTGVSLMARHHPLEVVFLRYAAHLTILLAVLIPTSGIGALRTRRLGLQLLRGVCMFGMPMCFVVGREFGSIRWIWATFWTMPAVGVIAAWLLLKERPHPAALAAVSAGALGGIAIMGGAPGAGGTVFGVGMGATVAGYMVLSRALRDEPLPASLFYTALGAIIPTAMLVGFVWTPVLPSELITIAIVGLFSVLILGAFDLSLEAGPVHVALPALALVPAWEAGLAVPLRHALPGTRELAGAVLIFTGFAALVVFHFATARRMSIRRPR